MCFSGRRKKMEKDGKKCENDIMWRFKKNEKRKKKKKLEQGHWYDRKHRGLWMKGMINRPLSCQKEKVEALGKSRRKK